MRSFPRPKGMQHMLEQIKKRTPTGEMGRENISAVTVIALRGQEPGSSEKVGTSAGVSPLEKVNRGFCQAKLTINKVSETRKESAHGASWGR